MLHTVVDPKAVAIQISIYICACVSYSTEDEEVEDDWSLGGVRGPKAGNALQEVCVHEVGNRGGFV